jgi:hypothetical protein
LISVIFHVEINFIHVFILNSRKNPYHNIPTYDNNHESIELIPDNILRPVKLRTLEAQVQKDDTLASIALRFHCTVMDIKTLNKIHNENEIYAFKVLKVPLTPQNVLLDTLPKVHLKSGESSPKMKVEVENNSKVTESKEELEEKLLVASVSNAIISQSEEVSEESDSPHEPLRKNFRGYPRTINPPKADYLDFNGSDCEMNWICLLICILAMCVIVPLIYVYLVYEHPEKFTHEHSRYDDPDLKVFHHINLNMTKASVIP